MQESTRKEEVQAVKTESLRTTFCLFHRTLLRTNLQNVVSHTKSQYTCNASNKQNLNTFHLREQTDIKKISFFKAAYKVLKKRKCMSLSQNT